MQYGTVRALLLQPDGGILIAGKFRIGHEEMTIARLLGDGTLDNTFHADVGGQMMALAQCPDGRIYVGGYLFAAGSKPSAIYRLHPNGALDLTYEPLFISLTPQVTALVVQPDGKLIAGGAFNNRRGGDLVRNLIRINEDGRLDPDFFGEADIDARVEALLRLPDGRIVVGGRFTQWGDIAAGGLIVLEANGTPSTPFAFDGAVLSLALLPNGKVMAGGTFGSVSGIVNPRLARIFPEGTIDESFSVSATHLQEISAISAGPAESVFVGGTRNLATPSHPLKLCAGNEPGIGPRFQWAFSSYEAVEDMAEVEVILIRGDGSDEHTEVRVRTVAGTAVGTIHYQPVDETIQVTPGEMSIPITIPVIDMGRVGGVRSFYVEAIYSADPEAPEIVETLEVFLHPSARRSTVGFQFWQGSTIREDSPTRLIRIKRLVTAVGELTVDLAPMPGTALGSEHYVEFDQTVHFADGEVYKDILVEIIPNDKVEGDLAFKLVLSNAVGGTLDELMEQPLVMQDKDAPGRPDLSFDPQPGANGAIHSLAIQTDGKILVGGEFTFFDGELRRALVRLNPDGSRDPTFNPMLTSSSGAAVNAVVVQPDGKIIIGGTFTSVNSVSRIRLARLLPDGSLDMEFVPGGVANSTVRAIVLQPDGRILVGGDFSSNSGRRILRLLSDGALDLTFDSRKVDFLSGRVRSLLLQPDGNVIAGGDFTVASGVPRLRIARFDHRGRLDASFDPAADNLVRALLLLPDGRIVAAGDFAVMGATAASRVAILHANGSLDDSFTSPITASFISAVAHQPDGKIVVSGPWMDRLMRDGSRDASFYGGAGGSNSIIIQPNFKRILAAGYFTSVYSIPRNRIAALNNREVEAAGASVFGLGSSVYSVDEGAGVVTLGIYRIGGNNSHSSVALSTADGSAEGGRDFQPEDRRIDFAPGDIMKTVDVLVPDNLLVDGTRSFTVSLHSPSVGNTIGDRDSAVISIHDDEYPLDYEYWRASNYSLSELADPEVSGPNALARGGTIPNLLLYALGLRLDQRPEPNLPQLAFSGNGEDVLLIFRRDPRASDVVYHIIGSSDLVYWDKVLDAEVLSINPLEDGNQEVMTVIRYDTEDDGRLFLRLKVESSDD